VFKSLKFRPLSTRELIGDLIGIIGILVGIYSYISYNAHQFRELTIAPSNYLPLLYANPIAQPKLKVFYNDEPIENLYLIELKIENTGNRDISASDFSDAIQVKLNDVFRILETEYQGTPSLVEGANICYTNTNEIYVQLPMVKTGERLILRLRCELSTEEVPAIDDLFEVVEFRVLDCNVNKSIKLDREEPKLEGVLLVGILAAIGFIILLIICFIQSKGYSLAKSFYTENVIRLTSERAVWERRYFNILTKKQSGESFIKFDSPNNLDLTDRISGKVEIEPPEKFKVAVYLRVYENWHNKPDTVNRTIELAQDGNWSFELYPWTDYMANSVRVDLVMKEVDVPVLGKHGKPNIPIYSIIDSSQIDLIGLDEEKAKIKSK
jgi:hypothetical protein